MVGRHALRRRLTLVAALAGLAGLPWILTNLGLLSFDAVLDLHVLAVPASVLLASLLLCRVVWSRALQRVQDDLESSELEGRAKDLSLAAFAALCLMIAMPILCWFAVVKTWEVAQVCAREFKNLVRS